MSFEVTKLLTLLLYPLTASLVLSLLSLLLSWRGWVRSGLTLLLLAIGWLYVASTSLCADFLMGSLEQGYTSRAMSVVEEADVIVLLGGGVRGDTHMGMLADLNQAGDRLLHAVALYKAGKAPRILLSGGAPAPGRTEAQQMKAVLSLMGVPDEAMLLENQSRNTHENALFSAPLLKAKGLQTVLLVTSAYHMPRSYTLFTAQGLTVVPAPTDFQRLATKPLLSEWLPTVAGLSRTTKALHEYAAVWMYRWRGWL